MSVFLILFAKLLPLYVMILLGFLAGKYLAAKKETIASILIYIIAPMVVFGGALKAEINPGNLSLPILFLVLCCFLNLLFFSISGLFWRDSTKNIMAFAAGTGNTGYFGLPAVLAVFGKDYLPPAIIVLLGFILYENSLGFYMAAKGNFTARESLRRLLHLPAIYTFLMGLALNIFGVSLGGIYEEAAADFQSVYAVLGMMLVGLALADAGKFSFDTKFVSLAFFAKFIVWPVSIIGLVFFGQ